MTLSELEEQYVRSIKECEAKGKEWAEKKAYFESIEDKRKPEIARLMGEVEGSQALREQHALGHEQYRSFLSVVSGARKDYLQATVNYDMSKLKVEAFRTLISTRRTEIANFKG